MDRIKTFIFRKTRSENRDPITTAKGMSNMTPAKYWSREAGTGQVSAPLKVKKRKIFEIFGGRKIPGVVRLRLENCFFRSGNIRNPRIMKKIQLCCQTSSHSTEKPKRKPSKMAKRFLQAKNFEEAKRVTLRPNETLIEKKRTVPIKP